MAEYTGGAGLRAILREESLKAPFTRVAVQPSGAMAVVRVYTAKPDTFRSRRTDAMIPALERIIRKSVTVEVTPEARALAKYVRVTPNKARRVLHTVRGMYVDEAMAQLKFTPNRAARAIEKVLKSAAANASEGWGGQPNELKISVAIATAGPTMKRIQPRAMGRAYRILKRSCHIDMSVQEAQPKPRRGGARAQGRARRAEVKRVDRKK